MLVHEDKLFKIYFGDAQDKISKENLVNLAKEKDILEHQNFVNLKKIMDLKNLVFLNQVHGQDGLIINSGHQASSIKSFVVDGDFLVTDVKHLAIGVLTADCLPIVFVDTAKKVVGVAHAGWRGSVGLIALKTLESMRENFGTNLEDVKIFFGPCIKSCCYKVASDFGKNLEACSMSLENSRSTGSLHNIVLQQKQDGLYFDLAKFNALLLQEFGVAQENISSEYNLCTMCDKKFYSYRRGDIDGRQATVVCLE